LRDRLVGQDTIKHFFENALSAGHMGHAYIFAGPQGIGKSTFATQLMKLLLCVEPKDNNPCNVCKACYMFDEGIGIDFVIVDESKNSISIDAIRDIQKQIIIRPAYSKRKVYLIKRAETMTEEAQNCLLKTLEEPPEYAVILLTTINPMSLRETVRSRSVRVDFGRYTYEEMGRILELNGIEHESKFEYWINASDGIPGRALELAGSDSIEELKNCVYEAIGKCLESKVGYIELVELMEKEKQNIGVLLDLTEGYLRDLLVIKTGANPSRLINTDKKDIILRNEKNFTINAIINAIAHIENGRKFLNQNSNFTNTVQVLALHIQEECNK